MTESIMRDRQRPLVRLYREQPATAWVTDVARTVHSDDVLHGRVLVGPGDKAELGVAVHTAVGGESDLPVPGDILAAALASCLDSTMRVVADRLRAPIAHLAVRCAAEVDVRGTLCVDPSVPVAFQAMHLSVDLELADGAPEGARERLLAAAEHCCVVLQTLKAGVPVRTELSARRAEPATDLAASA